MFYRWLEGHDFLAIKADRYDPLIILTLEEFAILLGQNRSQTENAASKPPQSQAQEP